MKAINWLLFIGILVFATALGAAFMYGEFWVEGAAIVALPWGKIMLFDLYLGFALFALLIFYIEKSWLKAVLWTSSLFVLGNIVALAFVLIKSTEIKQIIAKGRL